jgi:type VI secretion system protein ImpG
MSEQLFPYYESELSFIRQMLTEEFAPKYSKIARRLELEPDGSRDPHVQRLIEAFALLAGRVQYKIEDEFPQVTETFLNVLYPHYLRPIPSLAIVQFRPASAESTPSEASIIPAGTALHSKPAAGNVCFFRTCYPVKLAPVLIAGARALRAGELPPDAPIHGAAAAIRVDLQVMGGLPLAKVQLDELRFHLHGESSGVHLLYELLLENTAAILLRDTTRPGNPAIMLPPAAVRPVGFRETEGILPYSDRSFRGYRLLQEYFHYPEKFLFFDVAGFDQIARSDFGNSFELLFYMREPEVKERLARLEQIVGADTFQLGCTPAVNLFERIAEPMRLTQRKTEYRVIPDQHRQATTEVYSVDRVTSAATYQDKPSDYEPFYSFRYSGENGRQQQRFWYAKRRPSLTEAGADTYLSFVDLNLSPALPPVEMVSVYVTCTNRAAPARLAWRHEFGELDMEGYASVRARCVRRPTEPVEPPLGKGLLWRLVSHLTLNHLSIVQEGHDALRGILRLYDFSGRADIASEIAAITGISSRPAVSRVISETGIAFCRGLDVDLTLDEERFTRAGAYLMASVLDHFFGLYSAINSFTRLNARTKQRKGWLKKCAPRMGEQIIL